VGTIGRAPIIQEFQMHNKTFISSMVLSVACVSSSNAAVVYNTIDPFTTPASASASTSSSSGYINSALTGTLWEARSIQTRTSSTSRATTTMTVGSGSMVFGVTQVGSANTAVSTNQKATLDYYTPVGSESYPNFTNFTSLDFNYVSTLTGTLKCIIRLSDAANGEVVKTISAGSGLMSFTLADFGGITMNAEAMGPLFIEFVRSGSNASGSLTITNLVANGASIPAPGAVALLGAAGLVGARRRRA
jgi:MYXO-CTERM domain-containing protein